MLENTTVGVSWNYSGVRPVVRSHSAPGVRAKAIGSRGPAPEQTRPNTEEIMVYLAISVPYAEVGTHAASPAAKNQQST